MKTFKITLEQLNLILSAVQMHRLSDLEKIGFQNVVSEVSSQEIIPEDAKKPEVPK